jgi:hypothetical protein
MLDRVEMDVIDVMLYVGRIPDGVLPETPCPEAALTLRTFRHAEADSSEFSCEVRLDQPPTHRIGRIAFGQTPDRMHMIRQHDDGDRLERVSCPHLTHRLPEQIDMAGQQ